MAPSFEKLLSPRSIAVLGASDIPERPGGRPFQLMRHSGYAGRLVGVHPSLKEAQGFPCYPSIADIPFIPDLAIIALNRNRVLEAVAACADAGIGAAIIFSGGFADELTAEGRELQRALSELAARTGIAILGPNTLGLANLRTGALPNFASAFLDYPVKGGRITVIGQSGGACMSIFNASQARGLTLGTIVMTGNEASLGFPEFAEMALGDPETAAVAAYIEGLDDPGALRRISEQADAADKPVILYKVGDTAEGATAAQSHTARLAGDAALYKAGIAQLNLIRADDIEEVVEICYVAEKLRAGMGPRVAIVSASGALGAIMADKLVEQGAEVPQLPGDLRAAIAATAVPHVTLANPLDLGANVVGTPDALGATLNALLSTDAVDAVLFCATGAVIDRIQPLLIAANERSDKLLAILINGRCSSSDELDKAGIAVMHDTRRAAVAIARLGRWRQARRVRSTAPRASFPSPRPVPEAIGLARAARRRRLDEHEAKRQLSLIGIPVPHEYLVHDAAAAKRAAESIGFPVVMKLVSAAIAHKSELGGVCLGVTADAVETTFAELIELVRIQGSDEAAAVLVEEQIAQGPELLVGTTSDPLIGPMLTLAAGGTESELIADVVHHLLPATRAGVVSALAKLRTYPLLAGYRGKPAGDLDALVDAVMALADWHLGLADDVEEIEVNPFIVSASGIVAVDAVINLRPQT